MDYIAANWQQVLMWTSAASLFAVLLTLAGVPWVVGRLPADYFTRVRRSAWRRRAGVPVSTQLLAVLKNVLGSVLVLLGVVMLVTPGQGVLTILAGLLLMNFPGKYALERWLVMRPGVLRALDWLRHRRGQPPFEQPEPEAQNLSGR